MAIVVICPSCSTRMSAPDNAAGKHVRCPATSCGTLVPVAALIQAEAVEEAPRPKPVRHRDEDDEDDCPRSRRRRDEDDEDEDERPRRKKRRRDDDDDDYEFDHPRRRRRKKSGGAAKALVVIGIVVGVLLILGGIGYGIYALVGKGKARPPAGWKEYTYRDDGFKAYFPAAPEVKGSGAGFPGIPAGTGTTSFSLYSSRDGQLVITVIVFRFQEGFPQTQRERIMETLRAKFVELGAPQRHSTTWLGLKGDEYVSPQGMIRMVSDETSVYMAAVTRETSGGFTRATRAEEDGFFDNFVLLK